MKWLNHEESSRVLASGRLSNWFVDTDLFFEDIQVRDMIVEVWAQRILRDMGAGVEDKKEVRIFGVPSGGVRWAGALWLRLRDRSLLLYEYRDKRYAENTYIVDDVLTTGSTIKSLGADGEPVLIVVKREIAETLKIESSVTAWMYVKLPIGSEGRNAD